MGKLIAGSNEIVGVNSDDMIMSNNTMITLEIVAMVVDGTIKGKHWYKSTTVLQIVDLANIGLE